MTLSGYCYEEIVCFLTSASSIIATDRGFGISTPDIWKQHSGMTMIQTCASLASNKIRTN